MGGIGEIFGVGAGFSWSNSYGYSIYTTSISFSVGGSVLPFFSIGANTGVVK